MGRLCIGYAARGTIVRCVWGMALTLSAVGVWSVIGASHSLGQEPTGYQAAVVLQTAIQQAIARAERSVVAIARVRKQGPGARIPELPREDGPLGRSADGGD